LGAVRVRLVIPAFALLAPMIAAAQQQVITPGPAGARTIVGIVTDTGGTRIDSVDVFIAKLRRRTQTNADGVFRFEDIKPDSYVVAARRIGFYPQSRAVRVFPDGGVARFELLPIVRTLPPVVSSTSRGGLSGVIGDTAFNVVPGAEVIVVSGGASARTDSTGSFFIPVKPGRHMVRVHSAGFRSRILSVTIPKDSGRRIMVWMVPSSRSQSARETVMLFELGLMINRSSPTRYQMYTRDDILHSGKQELREIVRHGAGRPVDDDCMVLIDGGVQRLPLWLVDAADVEAAQVLLAPPPRQARRSITGNRPMERPAQSGCPMIFAWLRQ
jgi:hypothetical protein